jgi:hypothetical protein
MIHIQPILPDDSWCSTYDHQHVELIQFMRLLLFRLDVLARRHSNFTAFLSHYCAVSLTIHGYTDEKGIPVPLSYCVQDIKGVFAEVRQRFI